MESADSEQREQRLTNGVPTGARGRPSASYNKRNKRYDLSVKVYYYRVNLDKETTRKEFYYAGTKAARSALLVPIANGYDITNGCLTTG